jgi:hypothetical protein
MVAAMGGAGEVARIAARKQWRFRAREERLMAWLLYREEGKALKTSYSDLYSDRCVAVVVVFHITLYGATNRVDRRQIVSTHGQ